MFDLRLRRIERELFLGVFDVSLERFEPWVLDRLTDMLDEQHVPAGKVLWRAGEAVESLYFMHQGRTAMKREGAPDWIFAGRWFSAASRDTWIVPQPGAWWR
jgi:hypothetical protein